LQLCDQLHKGLPPSSLFYQALLQNLRKKQKLTTATSEDDLGSDAMAATTPSTPKTPATAVSTPLSAAATGNTPLSASAAARSTFFFGPDFNPEVGGSRVADPHWIRIQPGQWIRIQEGKNDPQKYKKLSCFEVLDGLF
jgi:hypothetical protein